MVDRLAKHQEWDLLAISRLIGGLAFNKTAERERFRRRFDMFQDILRESWVYQEIGQEFLEKGLAKGLEQGIEMGREQERKQRIQDQRLMLTNLVKMRFPELIDLAKQQAESINDPELLRTLNLKLMETQKLDEARKILFEADKQ